MKNHDLLVDLQIEKEKPLGLIGPNGIGKTSFIQFLKQNQDCFFYQKEVSFLDQFPLSPLGQVRCSDLFSMLGDLFPERVLYSNLYDYKLIEKFSFQSKLDRPIKYLSGGENQILKILCCFYLRSEVFILDEPSNHLDQRRIKVLIHLINEIAADQRYFIVIDHRKDVLMQVCQNFSALEYESSLDHLVFLPDGFRLLSSFLAGYLLTVSGSLIQGMTQNSLAAPSTLGLNAFAVAVILICHLILTFFPQELGLETLSLFVFLIPVLLVYLYALKRPRSVEVYSNYIGHSVSKLVLLGLCFNLFVGACVSILQFLFVTYNYSFPSQLWFGNFRFVDNQALIVLTLVSVFVFGMVFRISSGMRTLAFGTSYSSGLGLNVRSLQVHALFLSLISVGVVSSLFGVFAFFGLIFPHLMRSFAPFRYNFKNELIVGSVIGGVFLAILDWFCYQATFQGSEIPAGMISSLIGTFFLLLIQLKEGKVD
jgi:iron complex transport system permease protein